MNAARAPEYPQSPAAMARVGIGRSDDHLSDPRPHDRLRARRRSTLGATRFKRHIERCTFDTVPAPAGISHGLDFRMRLARPSVPASADDFAAFHQNRPYHWIWRSGPVSPAGQAKRLTHVNKIPLRHSPDPLTFQTTLERIAAHQTAAGRPLVRPTQEI